MLALGELPDDAVLALQVMHQAVLGGELEVALGAGVGVVVQQRLPRLELGVREVVVNGERLVAGELDAALAARRLLVRVLVTLQQQRALQRLAAHTALVHLARVLGRLSFLCASARLPCVFCQVTLQMLLAAKLFATDITHVYFQVRVYNAMNQLVANELLLRGESFRTLLAYERLLAGVRHHVTSQHFGETK